MNFKCFVQPPLFGGLSDCINKLLLKFIKFDFTLFILFKGPDDNLPAVKTVVIFYSECYALNRQRYDFKRRHMMSSY